MRYMQPEKTWQEQGEALANRVHKRFRHFHKKFSRQGIEAFRLYDWDIPDIRAVVDWYAGRLVMAEYVRRQSVPGWLEKMAEFVGNALNLLPDRIHLKQRIAGKADGVRYQRMDHRDQKITVSERDLKFLVNPWDFVDTGLFSDHRDTRQMVRNIAYGKDFLNLYCYTATFTCYAAKGGARSSLSADRSESTIQWARENLKINGLLDPNHELIGADTMHLLQDLRNKGRSFDLAVVDPPSFSTTRYSNREFDVSRDHPELLEAVIPVMRPDSIIFFSTNHQNFHPRMDHLRVSEIREITDQTIPEDYANKRKKIHRCWRIHL